MKGITYAKIYLNKTYNFAKWKTTKRKQFIRMIDDKFEGKIILRLIQKNKSMKICTINNLKYLI